MGQVGGRGQGLEQLEGWRRSCVVLIGVDDKAREGAVFVVVAPVSFASVQFDIDLVPGLQVQHRAVTGVVVVLIRVLGDGARADLGRMQE